MVMAHCLSSLQEELERTKQELRQLKQRETQKHPEESEIEDVKFVENLTTFGVKSSRFDEDKMEFQKKRYVTFANPQHGVEKLERHPSLRKKNKKSLIPFIGAIFSRKKGTQEIPWNQFLITPSTIYVFCLLLINMLIGNCILFRVSSQKVYFHVLCNLTDFNGKWSVQCS